MIDISPELLVIVMFGSVILAMICGYPLAFCIGAVGVFMGVLLMGTDALGLIRLRIWSLVTNYIFLAVPLFVFMGIMVEKSGAANRLYQGLHLAFGGFRGGLAISTILMGTILAACVGVIAASVIMIGLIAIPTMLDRNYDKELILGAVSAGGCLGILIPPSMMLIVYGPMAGISVGKLFMGAFGPGLLLSFLYMVYITIRCLINPKLAPPASIEDRSISLRKKMVAFITGMVPPLFLILSVLGVIFFGIAAPTEAAAIGAIAATLLALIYRKLSWLMLKDSMIDTMRITAMVMIIGWGANIFTGIFLRNGGGDVVANLITSAPFGRWGGFAIVMFLVFILGFVMDWIGIVFILVPILSPIVPQLGFDPLWFALMICVNLQMSFMTPPMAPAMFYIRGILKPEWKINTGHIIRGSIPFVGIIILGLILCIIFPNIIMWLPLKMIKF